MIQTLEWTPRGVVFIDQTKLPTEEVYVTCTTHQQVADVIRATVGRASGAHAFVTGMTAASVDFNQTMKQYLSLVFIFLLCLAFLLLLLSCRSVLIPLVTIDLNLLSVVAAYGLMVLVFQYEHLRSLIGAQNVGGVIDWIPLFLLVVLFGLSMDYHVLILSRIREGYERGLPTSQIRRAHV